MHADLAVRALVDVADGVAAAASRPAAAQPLGQRSSGGGGGERAVLLFPRPRRESVCFEHLFLLLTNQHVSTVFLKGR